MATAVPSTDLEAGQSPGRAAVNDFVINVATVNGSGSQSSNMILVRALFTMGIPCCGKNLFPSNIQGLPTWYVLRASEKGWLGYRENADVVVAMNSASLIDDVASMVPGATLLIDSAFEALIERDDIHVYSVPFNKLVAEICEDTRRRKMVVNIMYVGVLASMLGIDIDEVCAAIDWQFAKKAKAAQMNKDAVTFAYNWAEENLPSQDRVRVERRDETKGKILIEGNECTAIGLMFGGISVASWYPITPSSSVCEALTTYLEKFRIEKESGKPTFAVIQAEDELAAIGMVLGAGWAGARSATATSGPGISLMAEMAGLSYFAEIPAVIIDVQRMGPSTGLPTRNAQGDIMSAYNLSHGDCNHVLLLPGTMKECYEFGIEALDLAEQLQTMIFLMSDLDLGMNRWITTPLEYPEKPLNRGKVLDAEALDKHIEKFQSFARYRDVDGDGICYRTLPGTDHPNAAFFTRGTGHTEDSTYSEKSDNWEALMNRLTRKFETARKILPKPVLLPAPSSTHIGVIAFGSSDPAVCEAQAILAERESVAVDYLRVRALPPHEDIRTFIEEHRVVYVVEQNRDGQMANILCMEFPQVAPKLRKVRHFKGTPLHAETVVEQILAYEAQ